MIKIIQKGKDSFAITCPRCACIFSYELEDIGRTIPGNVKCPCCGEYTSHPNQAKILEEKGKEHYSDPNIQLYEVYENEYLKYCRPYTPSTPIHPSIMPEPYYKVINTSDASTTTVKVKKH